MAKPPNVLFMIADDHAARFLGGVTSTQAITPNLSQLAARGTCFTTAMNMGSMHPAVCAPSRAMLHTGRSLWRTGGDSTADYPLLGQTFRDHGYATFAVGKWHNGDDAARRSFADGQLLAGGMMDSTPRGGDAYGRPAPGNAWDPADTARAGHWLPLKNLAVTAVGDMHPPAYSGPTRHSSEHWADVTIDRLRAHAKREQPFFGYVAFHAPHDPRQAPPAWLDRFDADSIELPPNIMPRHPLGVANGIRDETLAPYPRSPEAIRLHRKEYFAILGHLDEQIGRILGTLRALDLERETIVVYTADHGLSLGEHGLMGKQSLYDHAVRVPLIVAGPGIPAGRRSAVPTLMQAIHPTLCDLAGIAPADTVELASLRPELDGTGRSSRDALLLAYEETQRAVRTDAHKLIVYPALGQTELFDMAADPWETRNIAEVPEFAPIRYELERRLTTLREEYSDPTL
ncbi:MAG TPA: sulfatase-like hydrolase/transferase [Tepidisphaeraceae bacterium]|nr:sulfatase-like hydrolase/transferase [Tepidisphaeraceae bacterium]